MNNVSAGLKSATLELSDRPAFVFYMADGYNASDFVFTQGARSLECELSEDGSYVRVVMYAYGMRDVISYSVNGSDVSGSYSIADYLEYADEHYSDEVVALTEALWAYSDAANSYREYVNAKAE